VNTPNKTLLTRHRLVTRGPASTPKRRTGTRTPTPQNNVLLIQNKIPTRFSTAKAFVMPQRGVYCIERYFIPFENFFKNCSNNLRDSFVSLSSYRKKNIVFSRLYYKVVFFGLNIWTKTSSFRQSIVFRPRPKNIFRLLCC
jgi:hypothetical protein